MNAYAFVHLQVILNAFKQIYYTREYFYFIRDKFKFATFEVNNFSFHFNLNMLAAFADMKNRDND